MNLHGEIREIFSHLRNILLLEREIGLESPLIPSEGAIGSDTGDCADRNASGPNVSPDALKALREQIGNCRRCKLHQGRSHLVFGEGSPRARLMFVGEGPGREEDLAGRPFVGEAGKILTRIIENGMGLSRKDVYIANIVKCRPPNNRDPEQDEIEQCLPFLQRQIRIIQPEIICALGRVAGQAMLGGDFRITRQRGTWFSYMGIPLMPTFHPAYLLRNPSAKRAVWDDIQAIMKRLGLKGRKHV